MDNTIEEFKRKIKRKAIVLDIGGFRPPEDSMYSWFGKVAYCTEDESWPTQNGEPMYALAQINVTHLPYRPKGLEDIDFIAIFIDSNELPTDASNGDNWLLRAYKDISKLIPMEQADTDSHIKPFPMNPREVEEDYPCWEDLPVGCPEEIDDDYYDLCENTYGFKLGGWPSLVQSEIYWAPWNKHEAVPEYIFQIDSSEKGNWMWADNGVGYFGRGTAKGKEDE